MEKSRFSRCRCRMITNRLKKKKKKSKDINQNNSCLQEMAILLLHQTVHIYHRVHLTFIIRKSKSLTAVLYHLPPSWLLQPGCPLPTNRKTRVR